MPLAFPPLPWISNLCSPFYFQRTRKKTPGAAHFDEKEGEGSTPQTEGDLGTYGQKRVPNPKWVTKKIKKQN